MPVDRNRVIFMVIFMIFGLVIALQFKSNLKFNKQKPSAMYVADEIKKQLEEEKAISELLKEKIKVNVKKNEEYLKAAVNDKGYEELNIRLRTLESLSLKAGLVDVKGPGVVIKLNDAPARLDENPNVLIIHDSDIIQVVNELKKAGAQAISINGERLIPTSEQVCAGPTVRINDNRYAAPFVISAIGNVDELYESLNKSETIALMVKDRIRVEITKSDEIIVPKYILPTELQVQSNNE